MTSGNLSDKVKQKPNSGIYEKVKSKQIRRNQIILVWEERILNLGGKCFLKILFYFITSPKMYISQYYICITYIYIHTHIKPQNINYKNYNRHAAFHLLKSHPLRPRFSIHSSLIFLLQSNDFFLGTPTASYLQPYCDTFYLVL